MQELGIALNPLVAEFKKRLFATGMVHNDDTPVNLLEDDREKPRGRRIRKARFWASCAPPRDGPWTVFDFAITREADGPKAFFGGYVGKITCDAYSGYGPLAESGEGEPQIVLFGCWAHVRRYFFNAYKGGDPKLGAEFVALVKVLYEIEETIGGKTDEERLAQRRSRSRSMRTAKGSLRLAAIHSVNRSTDRRRRLGAVRRCTFQRPVRVRSQWYWNPRKSKPPLPPDGLPRSKRTSRVFSPDSSRPNLPSRPGSSSRKRSASSRRSKATTKSSA